MYLLMADRKPNLPLKAEAPCRLLPNGPDLWNGKQAYKE